MILIVDASAVLPVVTRDPSRLALEERLFEPGVSLMAPCLIDLEVVQVLRRKAATGRLTARQAEFAIQALAVVLPIERVAHTPLLDRVWELRANLTAYDAAYVALAELYDAPMLTRDAKLARAPGHHARVELI